MITVDSSPDFELINNKYPIAHSYMIANMYVLSIVCILMQWIEW